VCVCVCVLLQCASVCVCGTGVRKLRPPWCQCTYKSLQHNPLQHTTHCNTQFTARLCEDTVDSTNVAPHMSRSRRRAGRLQDMRVACVMRHASHASASKTCVCIWSVSCAQCLSFAACLSFAHCLHHFVCGLHSGCIDDRVPGAMEVTC